jgi:hypothetical protein
MDDYLINELLIFGTNRIINIKAKRIVNLCLLNQKYDLANKIKRKYNLCEDDDFINSFSLALLTSKQLNK